MMRISDGQQRLELVQRGEVIWQAYINGRLTALEYLSRMHPIDKALARVPSASGRTLLDRSFDQWTADELGEFFHPDPPSPQPRYAA